MHAAYPLPMLQNGEEHSGIPGDFVCPPEATPQRDVGNSASSRRHFERRKSSFTLASPDCFHPLKFCRQTAPLPIFEPSHQLRSPWWLHLDIKFREGQFAVIVQGFAWFFSICPCTVIRDISDLGFIFGACRAPSGLAGYRP
jgi:hypothetical protein